METGVCPLTEEQIQNEGQLLLARRIGFCETNWEPTVDTILETLKNHPGAQITIAAQESAEGPSKIALQQISQVLAQRKESLYATILIDSEEPRVAKIIYLRELPNVELTD